MARVSSSARVAIGAAHLVLFFGWVFSVSIVVNEPAWFMSGALGLTFAACTIFVVMIPHMRTLTLRNQDTVKNLVTLQPERTGLFAVPAPSALQTRILAEFVHLPVPEIDAASARNLLIVAVLGLPTLIWYMINTLFAKFHPELSTNTTTRLLATALWKNNPGSTIVVLVLQSATLLLHLVDIIVAVIALRENTELKKDTEGFQ
jgi:hypothetical protein